MHDERGLSRREATVALAGGFVGLFGTYWDDAWHTDRGRDAFASPPHLALYAGVLVGLGVVLHWAGRERVGGGWWRAALPGTRTAVACWGGLAVLVSAPIDELWHTAYGRDAVLWSPPHLLAISGSAALLAGLVLGIEPGTRRAHLGGALALGAFLVPVMEYEADVPQFGAALYLPVVVLGLGLARPVLVAAIGERWPLTTAAVPYTAFRLLTVGGLAALGHSTPIVPPVLLAAVALDAVSRAGRWWVDAAALGVGVPLIYAPALTVLPASPAGRGSDLAVGIALSVVAALAVALPGGGLGRRALTGSVAVAIATVALALPAAAHDPGQGERTAEVELRVTVDDLRLDVTADLPDDRCPGDPVTIVGRRGGRSTRVDAHLLDGCVATGVLTVDEPGRWFVYVAQGREEAWLPVQAGSNGTVSDTRDLYRPPTPPAGAAQPLAGVTLVATAVALLVATSRAARSRPRRWCGNIVA